MDREFGLLRNSIVQYECGIILCIYIDFFVRLRANYDLLMFLKMFAKCLYNKFKDFPKRRIKFSGFVEC